MSTTLDEARRKFISDFRCKIEKAAEARIREIVREEIAKLSRASVGEDERLRLLLTVAHVLRADITRRIAWNGNDVEALDEALKPWSVDKAAALTPDAGTARSAEAEEGK